MAEKDTSTTGGDIGDSGDPTAFMGLLLGGAIAGTVSWLVGHGLNMVAKAITRSNDITDA